MITSAEEFVRLRKSDTREEYLRAAEEDAPMSVWFDIIDHYPDMKEWVVHNKTVPLEILRMLATDADRNVRAAVAEKRMLDTDLFDLLSRDLEEVVRQRLVYNKKTPLEVIERLTLDASQIVSVAATKRLRGRSAGC